MEKMKIFRGLEGQYKERPNHFFESCIRQRADQSYILSDALQASELQEG
jgi:hypothetical protein